MSYTEFVSALALVQGEREKSFRILSFKQQERPVVFQIFDSEEDRLEEAARIVMELEPDVLDINMGCSVRHVSGRGAGAGLLRDPAKIARIFERLVKGLPVPVTGKIRLGWDEDSMNYLEVARVLEDCGASLIAVHGRTRSQAYQNQANWDAIADIVEAVQVPVVGNGDVRTRKDIEAIKSHTGCAAVMIGRGAIGHPWIFQRRDRKEICFWEKARVIRRHMDLMVEFCGERLALILIRKHIARYLKGYAGIRDLQQKLVRVDSLEDFESLVEQVCRRLDPESRLVGS